eukprot:8165133-Heterocapsa_arctica.AAC.1
MTESTKAAGCCQTRMPEKAAGDWLACLAPHFVACDTEGLAFHPGACLADVLESAMDAEDYEDAGEDLSWGKKQLRDKGKRNI